MKRKIVLTSIILILLTLFSSCNLTPMEEGRSVNEYIFPYINFTLSDDGSYYSASILEDAAVASVYIPSYVDDFARSIPVRFFNGFEGEGDAKALKSITFASSLTSFSSDLFIYAENLESFSIEEIDSSSTYYSDLAVIEKPGYEFDGWYIKGTQIKRRPESEIIPGYTILEPRWKEHSLIHVDSEAATCTKPGMEEHYYCNSCNRYYRDESALIEVTKEELVIAPAHKLEHFENTPATCTEKGNIEYYRCTVCSRLFTDSRAENEIMSAETEALGHSTYFVPEEKKTCTEDGVKEHYKCYRCGSLFTDKEGKESTTLSSLIIKATGHNWERKQYSETNTCTWDECAECHETRNAAGHSWDDGVVEKEPTEEEYGVMLFMCTLCKHTQREDIAPLDSTSHTHSWVDSDPVLPGCITRGWTTRTCTGCGVTYNYKYENALGHSMTEMKAVKPTCTLDGNIKYYICSKCPEGGNLYLDINGINSTDEKKIHEGMEAYGHDWIDAWISNESGHWHECSRCGEKKDEAGHDCREEVIKKDYLKADATCEKKAVYYYSCECGWKGTETFEYGEPLEHIKVEHPEELSTCETQGHKLYYTCSNSCCTGRYYYDDTFASYTFDEKEFLLPYAHVFNNKKYETTDTTHTAVCDICHKKVETTKGNHIKEWHHDYYEHWWKCKVCGYESEKESHTLTGEVGKRRCETCGYSETESQSGSDCGFEIIYIDREPSGYLTAERDGTLWTFSLISTNDKYAEPEAYIWYVDGKPVDGSGSTYTLTAPKRRSYSVMCVFTANGYYASSTLMIEGGNNNE